MLQSTIIASKIGEKRQESTDRRMSSESNNMTETKGSKASPLSQSTSGNPFFVSLANRMKSLKNPLEGAPLENQTSISLIPAARSPSFTGTITPQDDTLTVLQSLPSHPISIPAVPHSASCFLTPPDTPTSPFVSAANLGFPSKAPSVHDISFFASTAFAPSDAPVIRNIDDDCLETVTTDQHDDGLEVVIKNQNGNCLETMIRNQDGDCLENMIRNLDSDFQETKVKNPNSNHQEEDREVLTNKRQIVRKDYECRKPHPGLKLNTKLVTSKIPIIHVKEPVVESQRNDEPERREKEKIEVGKDDKAGEEAVTCKEEPPKDGEDDDGEYMVLYFIGSDLRKIADKFEGTYNKVSGLLETGSANFTISAAMSISVCCLGAGDATPSAELQ